MRWRWSGCFYLFVKGEHYFDLILGSMQTCERDVGLRKECLETNDVYDENVICSKPNLARSVVTVAKWGSWTTHSQVYERQNRRNDIVTIRSWDLTSVKSFIKASSQSCVLSYNFSITRHASPSLLKEGRTINNLSRQVQWVEINWLWCPRNSYIGTVRRTQVSWLSRAWAERD